jgi:hypothetical protein
MQVIYKWSIPINDTATRIELPTDAYITHVAKQRKDGFVTFWYLCSDEPGGYEFRTFKVVGTGQEFENKWAHVGTVLDGPFVWHLLEDTTWEE